MKILFLALDINLGNKTGDSIHVRELASHLAELGNEIILITADIDEKSDLAWSKKIPNLKLFFNKTEKKFRNISTLVYCKKIAIKFNVDIIYERRSSPKVGVSLGKLLKIPVIIEVNGLPELEAEMYNGAKKKKSFDWSIKNSISSQFYKFADGIIAVTLGIKREIIQKYGVESNKIFVIQNGANLSLFKPMAQNLCRNKLGLNQNDKYICYVGNLAPWQGVEYLIKAAPLILEKENKINFIIIGDGILGNDLRRAVKNSNFFDKFLFTGKVPYEKVPGYINSSDVCVAPFIRARNERIGLSPLKIYEYLACGKPVVASDIEGVGSFLRETKSGIAVEPENHEKLADGLIELLQKENMAKEMGRNGREIVIKKHGWDNVAKQVMEVCRFLS